MVEGLQPLNKLAALAHKEFDKAKIAYEALVTVAEIRRKDKVKLKRY